MSFAIKNSKPMKLAVQAPAQLKHTLPSIKQAPVTKHGPGTNGMGLTGSHRYFPKKAGK